jgi:lipoyl(octanoyl) transferase
MNNELIIRDLGQQDYEPVWHAMQTFTRERDENATDEVWFVEHPPVYTQGVSGKAEHILETHGIPVVQANRGGQVTYHGPGQVVVYVLLNIARKKIGVRQLVAFLENAVIELLATYEIKGEPRADAPGVYVEGKKLAALGLRVSRGCSYHGLALNVDMDLTPFGWINPCGYRNLEVTSLRELGIGDSMDTVKATLAGILARNMGYTSRRI